MKNLSIYLFIITDNFYFKIYNVETFDRLKIKLCINLLI